MRPEPLTPEQARDPHEAWSNGWSNGFASAREVTDEMVKRAHRAYFDDPDGPSEVEAACMRNALVAAFQDKHEPQEGR